VQLAVRDHQPVALAEDFAADDGVARDEADGRRVRRQPDGFVPEAVEEGRLGVQVVEVDGGVAVGVF